MSSMSDRFSESHSSLWYRSPLTGRLSRRSTSKKYKLRFKTRAITPKRGRLIVGGEAHQISEGNLTSIISAIKKLPAPFSTIQKNYDESLYAVSQAVNHQGLEIIGLNIEMKEEAWKSCKKKNSIV